MKFKINESVYYPTGPNNIPKHGVIIGKGRYDNIYTIQTDDGEMISIRTDDKYDKWLKSINMQRRKKKSLPPTRNKLSKK